MLDCACGVNHYRRLPARRAPQQDRGREGGAESRTRPPRGAILGGGGGPPRADRCILHPLRASGRPRLGAFSKHCPPPPHAHTHLPRPPGAAAPQPWSLRASSRPGGTPGPAPPPPSLPRAGPGVLSRQTTPRPSSSSLEDGCLSSAALLTGGAPYPHPPAPAGTAVLGALGNG